MSRMVTATVLDSSSSKSCEMQRKHFLELSVCQCAVCTYDWTAVCTSAVRELQTDVITSAPLCYVASLLTLPMLPMLHMPRLLHCVSWGRRYLPIEQCMQLVLALTFPPRLTGPPSTPPSAVPAYERSACRSPFARSRCTADTA